ncbi:hypothetical protein CALVIDRAFT_537310 [Calocera viscosa TUFC12733]|uniref:Uncharacterized protein n=1 Tax=Calocera viscosa (strain TUFC12733) TaxID=1330018 RepID=A0A167LX26_CALVF|nr:hypothetical protein CALVIDRAFT_537310 [Calocera viscosa TUFC12733]
MSNADDNDARSTRTRSVASTPRARSPFNVPLPATPAAPRSRASTSPVRSSREITPPATPPFAQSPAPPPPPSIHTQQSRSRPASVRSMEPDDIQELPVQPQAEGPADPIPMLETLLSTMRQTLHTLTAAFDTLAYQTSQLATLRPALEGHHEIQRLKEQIAQQDQKMDQMKDFLSDTLKGHMQDVREGLKGHVEEVMGGPVKDSVRAEVEQRVMERVAEQISEKIPTALLDTVQDHKVQLSEVRRSLHNSEARRANGLLRTNNINEPLTPLIRSNGEISPFFPHDLSALFASPSPVAKQLVTDYDLHIDPDSRERNLNKFMGHIGVGFQMVPAVSINISRRSAEPIKVNPRIRSSSSRSRSSSLSRTAT